MTTGDKVKCWVCNRLREPSTWAGFSVPIGTLGTQVPAPYSTAAFITSAVCACMAVLLGEGHNDGNSGTA